MIDISNDIHNDILNSAENPVVNITNGPMPESERDATRTCSLYQRWLLFMCGGQGRDDEIGDVTRMERLKMLEEKQPWKRIVNVNACIALLVVCFLMGVYH